MKKVHWLVLMALPLAALLAGCSKHGQEKSSDVSRNGESPDGEVKAALAKLSAEDRKQALAQRYCAIQKKNLLGSMGVPVKLTLQGQPVFLCCKSCQKKALADPDRTLATVKELKSRSDE